MSKRITKSNKSSKSIQRYFQLDGKKSQISGIYSARYTSIDKRIINDFYFQQFQNIEGDSKYQQFDDISMISRSEIEAINSAFLLSCKLGNMNSESLFSKLKGTYKTEVITLKNIEYQEGVLQAQPPKNYYLYLRIIRQIENDHFSCPFIIFHIFSKSNQQLYTSSNPTRRKQMISDTEEEEFDLKNYKRSSFPIKTRSSDQQILTKRQQNISKSVYNEEDEEGYGEKMKKKKRKTIIEEDEIDDDDGQEEEHCNIKQKNGNKKSITNTRSSNKNRYISRDFDDDDNDNEDEVEEEEEESQTEYQEEEDEEEEEEDEEDEEDEEETKYDQNYQDKKQGIKDQQSRHQNKSSGEKRKESNHSSEDECIKVKISHSQQQEQERAEKEEEKCFSKIKVEENQDMQSLLKDCEKKLDEKNRIISQLKYKNHRLKMKLNKIRKRVLEYEQPNLKLGQGKHNPINIED